MPSEVLSSLAYWREIAHAEEKRGDKLEMEIGKLRKENNLLREAEKSRIAAHQAKLKRCGVKQ